MLDTRNEKWKRSVMYKVMMGRLNIGKGAREKVNTKCAEERRYRNARRGIIHNQRRNGRLVPARCGACMIRASKDKGRPGR
jgi:hypothetical protein